MAHPYHHAVSSAKKWGGKPEDYLDIHNWFDATKEHFCDFRHRALRHHSQGIFECEELFGVVIVNSNGVSVPVRAIGEQHVQEDLGRIPSVSDWLLCIKPAAWMLRKPVSGEEDVRIRQVSHVRPDSNVNDASRVADSTAAGAIGDTAPTGTETGERAIAAPAS